MLVENQWVEVKWHNKIKQHYIDKDYTFTKNGDSFYVKPEDLTPSSTALVKVKCDYCKEIYKTSFGDYNKGLKTINKSCCNKKECRNKKSSEIQLLKGYNKFLEYCKENNYTPVTKFEEYRGCWAIVDFICPIHGIQHMQENNLVNRQGKCKECTKERLSSERRLTQEELIKNLFLNSQNEQNKV